jgi:Domain of unknown function (DUF4126)
MTRAASTATTGGLANPLVSTLELAGATITSILAVVAPIIAVLLFVTVVVLFGRKLVQRFRTKSCAVGVKPGVSLTPTV